MNNPRKVLLAKIIIITAIIQGGILWLGWYALSRNDPEPAAEVVETINEEATQTDLPETDELGLADVADEPVEEASEPEETEPTPDPTPAPQPAPSSNIQTLNCGSNCTLAPVDKTNALPSTYNPGGLLTSTKTAYTALKNAATRDGLSIETISGFRSYSSQQSTFEYWVQTEINKGNSRSEAERIANTYSARPGHSEHQLGTTIDVKCAGCSDWGNDNQQLYSWIEDNAHKNGFVVSYPRNSEALTGYTYEPWHIRWIGVDLATELYNTGYINGNGNYLTKFLEDKGY